MILVGRSGIDKGGVRGPARRPLTQVDVGRGLERTEEDGRGLQRIVRGL